MTPLSDEFKKIDEVGLYAQYTDRTKSEYVVAKLFYYCSEHQPANPVSNLFFKCNHGYRMLRAEEV